MNKTLKNSAIAILAFVTLVVGSGSASAVTVDQLQAQITALLTQIQTLQSQLASANTGTSANTSSLYNWTRDLTLGSKGADVKALQEFLNNNGSPVAASGVGSVGNETEYFGPMTKAALASFQSAHGITPAVGYFGPITRSYIVWFLQ